MLLEPPSAIDIMELPLAILSPHRPPTSPKLLFPKRTRISMPSTIILLPKPSIPVPLVVMLNLSGDCSYVVHTYLILISLTRLSMQIARPDDTDNIVERQEVTSFNICSKTSSRSQKMASSAPSTVQKDAPPTESPQGSLNEANVSTLPSLSVL